MSRRNANRRGGKLFAVGNGSRWGAAVLIVVTAIAYLPALQAGFIWDDDNLVFNNRLVRTAGGLEKIWLSLEAYDYWPVTNTAFWIQWRLWGMHAWGYHAVNLALHIGSALLVWAILRRLLVPGAYFAALLFAVHPVNVESVAWISQLKNTLSLLFFLLSILWYLWAEQRSAAAPRQRGDSDSRRWYRRSVAAFIVAMLSKGSVAIGPFILLLIAWWQRGRIHKKDVARVAPYFAIAIGLTAVNIWFQTHGTQEVIRQVTPLARVLGAAACVWFYLYKALVPIQLIFVYPQWEINPGQWSWWAPLVAGLGLTTVLVWKRNVAWVRAVLFAWLWYCIALVPVVGLTDIYFMKYSLVADHYQYIAIIAVAALAAAGMMVGFARLRVAAWLGTVAPGAFVVLLAALTYSQCLAYASVETIFSSVLKKNPNCLLARLNLGSYYLDTSAPKTAVPQLQQAIALDPDNAMAHLKMGVARAMLGDATQAIEEYRRAIELKNPYPEAENNLGAALLSLGRSDEALACFERAVEAKPEYIDAQNNLGVVLMRLNRPAEAAPHFSEAAKLQPEAPESWFRLAVALDAAGMRETSVRYANKALELARAQGRRDLAAKIEAWLAGHQGQ